MMNAELICASSAICEAINPLPQMIATTSSDKLPITSALFFSIFSILFSENIYATRCNWCRSSQPER